MGNLYKTSNIKLSIVLPCYNMEDYIERAVMSIINQNLDFEYEIIAVDDCSTDNTYHKLLDLRAKYKQLKLLHHEQNQKLTGARTSGIKISSGEYIMLMDPDDYLLPNQLSDAIKGSEWNWDILFCNVIEQTIDSEKISYNNLKESYDLTNKKDRKQIYRMVLAGFVFAKVFKRSLFKDLIYFNYHYNIGEDRALNLELFNKANVVEVYSHPIYYYAYNQNSLIKKGFNVSLLDWEQSWVNNILEVSKKCDVCKESLYYALKYTERYSIAMLFSIKKDHNKNVLFKLWKDYFFNQSFLYGFKGKIYRTILKIDSLTIAMPFFLIMLGQWDPYKERLQRIFQKFRIE